MMLKAVFQSADWSDFVFKSRVANCPGVRWDDGPWGVGRAGKAVVPLFVQSICCWEQNKCYLGAKLWHFCIKIVDKVCNLLLHPVENSLICLCPGLIEISNRNTQDWVILVKGVKSHPLLLLYVQLNSYLHNGLTLAPSPPPPSHSSHPLLHITHYLKSPILLSYRVRNPIFEARDTLVFQNIFLYQ